MKEKEIHTTLFSRSLSLIHCAYKYTHIKLSISFYSFVRFVCLSVCLAMHNNIYNIIFSGPFDACARITHNYYLIDTQQIFSLSSHNRRKKIIERRMMINLIIVNLIEHLHENERGSFVLHSFFSSFQRKREKKNTRR